MSKSSKAPINKGLRIFRPSDIQSNKVFRSALRDLPFLSELECICRSRVKGRSIRSISSSKVLNAGSGLEISKSYLAGRAKGFTLILPEGEGEGNGI